MKSWRMILNVMLALALVLAAGSVVLAQSGGNGGTVYLPMHLGEPQT